MANDTVQMMAYANNAIITTKLLRCAQTVNLPQIVQDLYDLYQNTNSNVFYNISIINFDCNTPYGKYFEQIITFTKSISIHIQVALGSVYFDYITANRYSLHGFFIERDERFNLSSITLNYTTKSDACSSGEVAQDPLCPLNSTTPRCIEPFTNPWIFNCSTNSTTSPSFPLSMIHDNGLLSTIISSILNSWQISLLCGSSLLFFLMLLLLAGYFSRRHAHSNRIALSCEYLLDNKKSMPKSSEIAHGQAFQRAVTIIEPKINSNNNTTIACINDTISKESYITVKSHGPKQRIFIDHTKIHDSFFPSIIPEKSSGPIYIPTNHANILTRKVYSTTIIPRPIYKTSMNRLKSITDGLEEHTFDESDDIILDRSNTTNPKKANTSEPKQTGNKSFADESLHDEDAWMSILAVANAELDMLDQLENDETRMETIM